jgi:hypothetical protein
MQGGPEDPVERVHGRPGPFPLENRDWLPEGEDFEGGIVSTAEEDAHHGEDGEDEFGRELTVATWGNGALVAWSGTHASHSIHAVIPF